tara:strand:- start:8241 stop:8519 length:279 start_codon:yes stop_codon:yes gene_type:complete
MFFRKKVEKRKQSAEDSKQRMRDLWTAEEFYKGLKRGDNPVGSLLFSKHKNEEKIVKQICRYTGHVYKERRDILCKHPHAANLFYVTHYFVK